MTELLLDRLGTTRSPAIDDPAKTGRQRRRALSGILEWVQCFTTYMAVCCRKQPHQIHDLIGYQTLIVEASLEYQGDGWMGYDRQFWLRAAANPTLTWANIYTLWSLAFAGQASASHCCHCFCLSHTTDQCNWAPNPQPFKSLHTTTHQYRQEQQKQQHSPPICKAWNNDPRPLCPIPHCSYKHICGHCFSDTHKGYFCPHAACSTTPPYPKVKPLFRQ